MQHAACSMQQHAARSTQHATAAKQQQHGPTEVRPARRVRRRSSGYVPTVAAAPAAPPAAPTAAQTSVLPSVRPHAPHTAAARGCDGAWQKDEGGWVGVRHQEDECGYDDVRGEEDVGTCLRQG